MEFSTYENASIDLPLDQFRRTDTLLSYHVELLLVPISYLYAVFDSPLTLLVLQTVVIALGVWPVYWLARRKLRSELAGVAFVAVYLIAPSLQGANLSDFHAVSLTPTLLLFAFWALENRRTGPFLVFALAALSAREDMALLVVMLGLYAFLLKRQRVAGALACSAGVGWFLICTQVILPSHNGLPISPFLHRLAIFGPTVQESLQNWLNEPDLLWHWLRQPDVVTYLKGLLASGGYASLLGPGELILAAPVLATNVLSTWSWTYSEGAHYSASIVPFIVVSSISGVAFLSRQISRLSSFPMRYASAVLAGTVLLVSGAHHYQLGITPPARSFSVPRVTEHHDIGKELMTLIPPDASVSAQTGLYPHLAHREKAYLFPAVNDAEFVFLDVTGSTYPIDAKGLRLEVQWLLNTGEYGLRGGSRWLSAASAGLVG